MAKFMINKQQAIKAALDANEQVRQKSIVKSEAWFLSDRGIWRVIISFDEYNEIGDQSFAVYNVDPETGDATNRLI